MIQFHDRRFLRKMTIVMMLTSGIALLLACGAFVTNDFLQLRGIFQRELSTTGNLVAASGATALSLGDSGTASQTLQALGGDGRIVAAALYANHDEKPLASYYREGAPTALLTAGRRPGMYKEAHSIVFIRNIVLNGEQVGTLGIRADTSELSTQLGRDLLIAALVMISCIPIALLLTSRLRRIIAQRTIGDTSMEDASAERTVALEHANSELITANSRAEEAARLKGEFLATLSHEIRTPMTGMIGMAQLALETDLTAEQRMYVASASNSAESMLKVIDDIIDFSRIEAGGLTLEREEFGISETLYEIMGMFSPAARQKGLALLLDVHQDVPVTVMGDRVKFRQVIENLIDNALKFTDNGAVTVAVAPVFHSDRVVGLHLKVKDTGRGLAKDQFERAVEPFEQVHDSNSRLIGGTGLGLAISNRLIGMMGGSLWLESEPGSGSTFHFTATFEASNRPASLPLDLNDLRGASVLVADTSATTRRILQQLLSRWQMRPTLAASGLEAMDLMRAAVAAGNPFDMALIDRHMLGIAGSELAKEIREHPELGNPVITVLSSINTVSVTDLTREFRAASYLVKPVSHATLLKAVSGAMHSLRGDHRGAAPLNTKPTGQHAHILVAEDNVLNQAVAVSILRKEGYEVTVASDGVQAVDAYDRGGLDLILMDVELPGMSGIEATRLIRLKEADLGGHIAILALTAHAMAGDRESCLEAGMDDYVSKPLQVPVLREVVSRWLGSRRPAVDNPNTTLEPAA